MYYRGYVFQKIICLISNTLLNKLRSDPKFNYLFIIRANVLNRHKVIILSTYLVHKNALNYNFSFLAHQYLVIYFY